LPVAAMIPILVKALSDILDDTRLDPHGGVLQDTVVRGPLRSLGQM
jgi:hypothetical protein